MKTVDVADFERDFDSLLQNVEDTGETIQVSRQGVVFAELRPIEDSSDSDAVISAPTSVD